jgi:hypothetical protein
LLNGQMSRAERKNKVWKNRSRAACCSIPPPFQGSARGGQFVPPLKASAREESRRRSFFR